MNADTGREIPVWDPGVRLFHWTLAGAFPVVYVTGDHWESVHVNAGYVVGLLVALRLLWGFLGPSYARFSNFLYPPKAVLAYAKDAIALRARRYIGHNPAGGVMVAALLVSLALTISTGIALYGATDFAGPLAGVWRGELASDVLEGGHELGANLTLALVALHLAGVLFSSLAHGENLIKSMFTGRKKELRV